jgi:hypothetical protein
VQPKPVRSSAQRLHRQDLQRTRQS